MKTFCKMLLCISVFFLLMVCSACGSAEYSVKDFADIKVVGYTEHGTLSIKVNDAAINNIYADGKKDKTAALRFAETFRFTYEGQNDEDSYFSNGDTVTINVSYDTAMASALGLKFIDSSFDYVINGLQDKRETSPFDGLSVKFSGVAPYGTPIIDKSNCIQYVIDNVTFYCDNYDLSNGDKVVVRAEFNSEVAERNGYIFSETVKKYTVVGLPRYVSSMAGVTYSTVTAKMRVMAEKYISDSDDSYKSLDWFFGEDDTDTDVAEDDSDELGNTTGEDFFDDDSINESEDDDYSDDTTDSDKKSQKISDVQKIKNDFVLSDFKAKFEYIPIECDYGLNPLQYSDNQFYSIFKVKGTFVCEDTAGSGYIKKGDTLVGEIYVITRLTGGSVDVKNNLFYEDSVLTNFHSYSIKSVPEYDDVKNELYKSTTYLVEALDYVEAEDAYDDFVKKLERKTTKTENSHITIDTSTDKEKREESSSELTENSSEPDTDTDTDNLGGYQDDVYYVTDDNMYDDYYEEDYGENLYDEEYY